MLLRIIAIIFLLHPSPTIIPRFDFNKFDTTTGTLIGRVRLTPDAPLPGVRVRVTNLENGMYRSIQTDANGEYRFPLIPLGLYSIDASKEGYFISRPTTLPIKIQLNRLNVTAPDIIMAPVVVAATTPTPTPAPAPVPTPPVRPPGGETLGRLVNQTDASRRFNFESRQLSALPLVGSRTFDDLALLAPGVGPAPEVRGVAGPGIGAGIGSPGQFAVNGLRARANNFTVDGAGNNDEDVGVRRQGFVILTSQSVESVRELQVITQLWDSEQGRNFGSQLNAVSRSGENRVYGTLYGFITDHALNAHDFFDYRANGALPTQLMATAFEGFNNGQPINPTKVPVSIRTNSSQPLQPVLIPNPSGEENYFQRYQYGGNLGLPIRRDHTFAFVSYERLRTHANEENHFAVPTIADRGFLGFGASGFAIDQGSTQRIFNPTFVAGDAAFTLFPFPNNPNGPYGENTFTQILSAQAKGESFSIRIDHQLSGEDSVRHHQLTGRYNFATDERDIPAVGEAIYSSVRPEAQTQNLSLFLNSQLNNHLSNQFRASFGRSRLRFSELRDPANLSSRQVAGEPFLLNAGMLYNFSDPRTSQPFVDYLQRSVTADSVEGHLGTVGQVVISPYSPVGLAVDLFPQGRVNNTFQFADTAQYSRGDHATRFGFDLVRTHLNSFLNRNYRPQVFFGGTPDLTNAVVFNPLYAGNPQLIRGLSQFGPTPGYFRGADLAALGLPTGITQSLRTNSPPDSSLGLRFWQMNYFFTDQWRVRPQFLLSFGLRYEYNTVPRDSQRRIENAFGFATAGSSTANICRPFTSCSQVFSSEMLTSAFNSTLTELRRLLDGRKGIYDPDRNNFSPHAGFAWSPFSDEKTVIRGGISLNYDLLIGNLVSQSRNVFPNFIPLNVDANTFAYASQIFFSPGQTGPFAVFNPQFVPIDVRRDSRTEQYALVSVGSLNTLGTPNDVFAQLAGLLFAPPPVSLSGINLSSGGGLAFTLPERSLRSPYALHFNLQVEREFAGQWLANIAYVGTRGVNLTRFRTPNGGPNSITLPFDPLGLTRLSGTGAVPNAVAIAPGARVDQGIFTRLNPRLGAYTFFDSSAGSNYHALQTSVQKRFSRGFMMTGAYTWSHAIDEVSDIFDLAGAPALPQSDNDLRAERGRANFDLRHRLAVSLVAELPFLKLFGRATTAQQRIFGGWQAAFITVHQSGQPFTVNSSLDVNLNGNLTDRLDQLSGLVEGATRRERLRLSPGVNPLDLLAPVGNNGQVGRNVFRASAYHQTDLALMKNISLQGEHTLAFRVECFNLWNRPQFAIPVRILEAPSFGASVATRGTARQIQFALKYVF
jgi:hypothetical protein